MDDMDFTKPHATELPAAPAAFKAAASAFYDAAVASKLFRAGGKEERFKAGQSIFNEADKASSGGVFSMRASSRMYFLASGEVALTIHDKPLDAVKEGEVFGEMAVISNLPRTASATAKTDCVAYSLDVTELQKALAITPEFALMLMSVMFDRLRFMIARLSARKAPPASAPRESPVFDQGLLAQFEAALPRPSLRRYPARGEIMKEGQTGAFMYILKEGRVAIWIRDKVIEVVNPGGTFGEMAVVDQSPRTANATADTECELLAVDRASLLEALKSQPAFAMAMMRAVAERIRHMNEQLA
jgi:CRP/FNR family transcriptional regulator, cyclic AMP receptor protein